jgi:hypothetical protein
MYFRERDCTPLAFKYLGVASRYCLRDIFLLFPRNVSRSESLRLALDRLEGKEIVFFTEV